MPLLPVDRVEILTVLDNSIDVLLSSTEGIQRFSLSKDSMRREPLVAEHGFSALVTVVADGHEVDLPPPDRRALEQEGISVGTRFVL
jgi:hypothetical protein